MRCLSDDAIRPLFKQRIFDMRDSRGAVQVFLRLSARLESIGATAILTRTGEDPPGDPPIDVILVTQPEPSASGPARVEAMTYMDYAPFAAWKRTRIFARGAEYDAFKARLAERMIAVIARLAPELPDRIVDGYAATPLTDAHYTLNEHGAVFGVSHDIAHQGMNRPMPRMRLRNLYFSGHSIMMPGICGVFINAFSTCDRLIEGSTLFASVAT